MKSKLRSLCRAGTVVLAAFMAWSSPPPAHAIDNTNSRPYRNTFEQYSVDTILDSSHGWYSEETNALIISEDYSTYTNTYGGIVPFRGSNHVRVVELNSTATNRFALVADISPGWTNNYGYNKRNYVDMMIKPRRWTLDDPPTVTGNVQMAAYFDSNGVVWAWGMTNLILTDAKWQKMDNASIDTNAWIRFTIVMSYCGSANTRRFQILMDGTELRTPGGAISTNSPLYSQNGSWLRMHYGSKQYMSSVTMQGTGHFDDMDVGVTTTNAPYFGIMWMIRATATNGVIVPSGNVPVVNGNNKTFTITDATGYDVTNVVIGGSGYTNSLGPTTSHTFTNVVTSNHWINVLSKPENRKLVVSSQYGSPNPSGTNIYPYKTSIPASVAGSPVLFGSETQYVCTGWTRTTSTPGSGSGTNTSFQITGSTTASITTLTWNWAMRHKLTTVVDGTGSVSNSPVGPWYYTYEMVTVTAYTNSGSTFTGWTGDTNGAVFVTNNILMFTNMLTPRAITAHFTGGISHTTNGTPYAWILHYYPGTNCAVADNADTDNDTLSTWEEYLAGTCPTNADSFFQVLATGVQNGSNYVKFYGGFTDTISSLTLPFGMYRSTNLLNTFQMLPGVHIPRASNGTNWYWEATPSGTRYFYRPAATNNNL